MRVKNGIPESMIVHCCLSSSSLARSMLHYLSKAAISSVETQVEDRRMVELADAVIVKPRPFFRYTPRSREHLRTRFSLYA